MSSRKPLRARRVAVALPAALALGGLLSACGDDSPSGPREGDDCSSLPTVGAVCERTASETGTVRLEAGSGGAEYLYVPFFASRSGTALLSVEVDGPGATPPTGPPNPARLPAARDAAEEFHLALRERERRLLDGWAGGSGAARTAMQARRQVTSAAVPAVGDLLTLNTTATCSSTDRRTGRVAAVSQRAIILLDVANPAGGFTDADAAAFAARFDNLVYPVAVRNFGEPTDIDANGRSIIFFTRAVNELTEPNSDSFVGGFFWTGDLLPRTAEPNDPLPACAGSNVGEVFYMLAPDPAGEIGGNDFSLDFVRSNTVGTLGHEYQHLINASRRLFVNDATTLEEVWLNEGLSHIAEELLFYEVTGLSPRENLDRSIVSGRQDVLDAFIEFGLSNLGRYSSYLRNPKEESLLGVDNLPTRGASWAFLRYAADHEPGADQAFFLSLVNSRTSGVPNLREVLGADPIDWMQRWTVSVYTDDTSANVEPIYTQPSWDFRSLLPLLNSNNNRFPLEVQNLAEARTFSLRGGGAAFVRFGVASGSSVTLRTTSGGGAPPANLRVSVVRIR